MHSLRPAAARMGCELLLVYLQADSSVDNYNDAAALYWTLIGLWLVPGNVYEHRTVMQGVLMDCRTGMILGTVTGDCHREKAYAAAYQTIAVDQLSSETPAGALADMQKGFAPLIRSVADRAAVRTSRADR